MAYKSPNEMSRTPIILRNAHLIDGTGTDSGSELYTILVDGNRIISVSPNDQINHPENAWSDDTAWNDRLS